MQAQAQAGGRTTYCCDVGGQPVCGDILPAACYGRAYREMSPSGLVRRTVAAPLTPQEIANVSEYVFQSFTRAGATVQASSRRPP